MMGGAVGGVIMVGLRGGVNGKRACVTGASPVTAERYGMEGGLHNRAFEKDVLFLSWFIVFLV